MASTLLPEFIATTLVLCLGVGCCAALLGVGAAWVVTHFDVALRRCFESALVLPLAMPAYVMAYTYTDLLQFTGALQSWLRGTLDWRRDDYWFPEVRSLGGAVLMFASVLYPYVYLLARTALLERGSRLMEAGRSLGLTGWGSFVHVSLPMARPAVAAGVALVLMETLADYGTVSYFGVQIFTTGIYRAWFSLGDRSAAAVFGAHLSIGSASALNGPTSSSAGFFTVAVLSTGHSLLPSAKQVWAESLARYSRDSTVLTWFGAVLMTPDPDTLTCVPQVFWFGQTTVSAAMSLRSSDLVEPIIRATQ